jgi:hypothetical protein
VIAKKAVQLTESRTSSWRDGRYCATTTHNRETLAAVLHGIQHVSESFRCVGSGDLGHNPIIGYFFAAVNPSCWIGYLDPAPGAGWPLMSGQGIGSDAYTGHASTMIALCWSVAAKLGHWSVGSRRAAFPCFAHLDRNAKWVICGGWH